MGFKNNPIQVILYCNAEGEFQPLRFQLLDFQNHFHTIQVEQVLDTRSIKIDGRDSMTYLCKTLSQDDPHLFELKYDLDSHKWFLFRQIY